MPTPHLYILSLLFTLLFTTIIFRFALHKKDNSIIDRFYGIAFIVTALLISYIVLLERSLGLQSIAILFFIILWGVRLSIRINAKNKQKGEDFRYKEWREVWGAKGHTYFVLRSYLQIFVLQAIVVSIVLLPFTLSLLTDTNLGPLLFVGAIVWCIGFFFEALGDAQLDAFIRSTDVHKGTVMKRGLWKYTRHPNYFGESTMWWGLALIAFGSGASGLVFLSPLLITYLLLFVSGVPMLEKKWKGNIEWEAYKNKTSVFFPLPPRN